MSVIGATIVGVMLNGLVLQRLWGWFMVGTFGLPALTIPQALGMWLVFGFIMQNEASSSNTEDKTAAEVEIRMWTVVIGRPLIALVFGWVVLQFMGG